MWQSKVWCRLWGWFSNRKYICRILNSCDKKIHYDKTLDTRKVRYGTEPTRFLHLPNKYVCGLLCDTITLETWIATRSPHDKESITYKSTGTTKVQLGELLSLFGYLQGYGSGINYRSRNYWKIAVLPKAHHSSSDGSLKLETRGTLNNLQLSYQAAEHSFWVAQLLWASSGILAHLCFFWTAWLISKYLLAVIIFTYTKEWDTTVSGQFQALPMAFELFASWA